VKTSNGSTYLARRIVIELIACDLAYCSPLVAAANDIISREGSDFVTGNSKKYDEQIVRDSRVCGGEPVFKGTRVTLRTVLASLAAGDSAEEILADFPSLKPEDIRAAIAFAAASAEEDLPVPAIPHVR
jgi:uncharacterized protein (DUF433 family)